MTIKQIDIAKALTSLNITNTFVSGVPTNNEELISMTARQDDNGNEIALGVTWTEINNEITRLNNLDTQKATDKTNAETKLKNLGLSDDEIKAFRGE